MNILEILKYLATIFTFCALKIFKIFHSSSNYSISRRVRSTFRASLIYLNIYRYISSVSYVFKYTKNRWKVERIFFPFLTMRSFIDFLFLFRLYTEDDFDKFFDATPPEMQRSDLAPAILQLKALGIDNILRFNFPSPPPTKSLLSGLELLYALGAINDNGELTDFLGVTMAEMPLEPVYAKCLIISGLLKS